MPYLNPVGCPLGAVPLVSLKLPTKTAFLIETATALVSWMTNNPNFTNPRSAARKDHGRRHTLDLSYPEMESVFETDQTTIVTRSEKAGAEASGTARGRKCGRALPRKTRRHIPVGPGKAQKVTAGPRVRGRTRRASRRRG
jgi:hypothetical protein